MAGLFNARVRVSIAIITMGSLIGLSGCASEPAADPAPRTSPPPSAAPSSSADGWETKALSFDAGANIPDGLDTVVVNSLPGHPDFTATTSDTVAETAYEDTTNGCVVTTGVYDQSEPTTVGDREATSGFLSRYLALDMDEEPASSVASAFVGVGLAPTMDDPESLPQMEFLGLAFTEGGRTALVSARTVEKVGKTFLLIVDCPSPDAFKATNTKVYQAVGFGFAEVAALGG